MTLFADPKGSLGYLDVGEVAALIAAAGDILLVVDRDGVIQSVALNNAELATEIDAAESWLGRRWDSCLATDSHPKVAALIRDAADRKPPRWVHLNHLSRRGGADIPVLYAAVQVGDAGRIVALGRDLRAASTLQQRLVDAQQSMERDYIRLRHAETRYRLLFETSSEALLVVDPVTLKPMEANPAVLALLQRSAKQIVKQPLPELFEPDGAKALETLLSLVRGVGRGEPVVARLAGSQWDVVVSASVFRQDNASLILVRLLRAEATSTVDVLSSAHSAVLKAIDGAPDGFVLTMPDGRIVTANAAFREMTQLATEEQARAGALDRWLGRTGVDMNVMTATLRQRGTVLLFATTLRGEYGSITEVEISAASFINVGQTYYGFVIRDVGRRIHADPRAGRDMPRSVDQLTELIGRVPLKDLVREATDMIERLCIQAALEVTGDNRASAADARPQPPKSLC